jgi:hypothetical protein
MRKSMKIALIIIIVVMIIAGLYVLGYYIDPMFLDKTNHLSKEEIQDILDRRYWITNIYTKYTMQHKEGEIGNLTLYSETYLKDDIAKHITYYENGKKSIVQENRVSNDIINISENEEVVARFFDENFGAFHSFYQSSLYDVDYYYDIFKYLGRTTINGRDSIVIKLQKKGQPIKQIVYIDVETGLITKLVEKNILFRNITNTEIKLGVVTDQDVTFIDYGTIYPDFRYVEMQKTKGVNNENL